MKARFLLVILMAALGWNGMSAKEAYVMFYKDTSKDYGFTQYDYDSEFDDYRPATYIKMCFFFDDLKETRLNSNEYYLDSYYGKKNPDVFLIDEDEEYPKWYNRFSDSYLVVDFDQSFADYRPTSTKHWFDNVNPIDICHIENLNTSMVKDMSYMFANCSDLRTGDAKDSDWEEWSLTIKVDYGYVINHLDFSSVKDMSHMFDNIEYFYLEDIYISNDVKTDDCFNKLQYLELKSTNISLPEDFFKSAKAGCYLIASDDFDFIPDSSDNSMIWKGATFVVSKKEPYALWRDTHTHFIDYNEGKEIDRYSGLTSLSLYFDNRKILRKRDCKIYDDNSSYETFTGYTSTSHSEFTNSCSFDRSGKHSWPNLIIEESYNPYGVDYGEDSHPQAEIYITIDSSLVDYELYSIEGWFDFVVRFYSSEDEYYEETLPDCNRHFSGLEYLNVVEPVNPFTVGDTITYLGLKYKVTKINDDGSEVVLIKNPTAMGNITIPSTITDETGFFKYTVTSIEEKAFYNCDKLTSLSIPASVTSIGKAITSCCTILGSITVDADNPVYDSRENSNAVIETQTGRLIAGCNNTTIPEGVTVIGSEAMRGMFDLKDITLPSTLKTIEGSAFYYCKGLKDHLRIPDGVTAIGSYAFYKCTGLTSLYIPGSVTTLGTYAFRECTGLTTVRCRIPTPLSINSKTFANYANCTLMVPTDSKEAYQKAAVWKTFKRIMSDDNAVTVECPDMQNKVVVGVENGDEDEYTGYQFDIILPSGMSLTKTAGSYGYTLAQRFRGSGISCSVSLLDDGSYRVMCYSTNRTTISGTAGALVTLSLAIEESVEPGTYNGQIVNFMLNDRDNNSVHLDDTAFAITVADAQPGDVNSDGTVNISDVLATVDYVLGKNPVGFHVGNADLNGDGEINISDVLSIVDIILGFKRYDAPANARMALLDNIYLTGMNCTYTLCLDNKEYYSGCQMRLSLPEGCTLRDVSLMADRADGHHLTVRAHGEDGYTFIIYSSDGKPLRDVGAPLLQFAVSGAHSESDIQMTDIQFVNSQLETVLLPDVKGATTGTTIITHDSETMAPAYNMLGQRVHSKKRGLVISQGRKHIRK